MKDTNSKQLAGKKTGFMKGLWGKLLKGKDVAVALTFALIMTLGTTIGNCTEDPAPALSLNFNMSEMFSWTQMILDVMLPVLYITLGVSLAFIIIRALKQAFN